MQIFECVHTVAGVDVELLEAGPAPALRNLIGTSFHLGVQRFMSAAHVLREVERYPLRAITYFVGPEIRFAPVSEIEYAEHLDIGVFRAKVPNAATPRWSFRGEALLEGIVAGGFPYALDTENKSITVRTFRGYIVAAYRYIQMTGQPGVYETSSRVRAVFLARRCGSADSVSLLNSLVLSWRTAPRKCSHSRSGNGPARD